MATNTAGSTARELRTPLIHFMRKTITYLDAGDTVTVGVLPAGATIIKPISGVQVNVAFNGDTSNILDIGPSTNTDLWMTDGALGSIAFVPLDEAVSMNVASDTIVQAAVVSTAGATAGSAEIIIAFVPDLDG